MVPYDFSSSSVRAFYNLLNSLRFSSHLVDESFNKNWDF